MHIIRVLVSDYIMRFIVLLSIISIVWFGSATASAQAVADQQAMVLRSCLIGDIGIWPPRREHNRMCSLLPLKAFMPSAPSGYEQQDIHWVYKLSASDPGFREDREITALFNAFGTYPFIKYVSPLTDQRYFIFGTIDAEQVRALTQQLVQFSLENGKQISTLTNSVRFYSDMIDRKSLFRKGTTYRITHVIFERLGYFIIYSENDPEHDMEGSFLHSIDYDGIKEYLSDAINAPNMSTPNEGTR